MTMMGKLSPYRVLWSQNLGTSIISVSSTPNASTLVAGTVDRRVTVFSSSGSEKWSAEVNYEVWATSISADGSRVAAGTAEKKPARGSLYIFDGSGHPLWRYDVTAPIWSICFSADGRRCLAGCWDGNVYAFIEHEGTWTCSSVAKLGRAGVYGVSISDSGDIGIAAQYDFGLHCFRWPLKEFAKIEIPESGYHTALNHDGTVALVGLRQGSAAIVDLTRAQFTVTPSFTQHPICATAISGNGAILALGSFDGKMYLVTREGRRLWSLATDGEVWDLSLTKDARFVVVGSGDGRLLLVENLVANAALLELRALEKRAEEKTAWTDKKQACDDLIEAYRRYGVVTYGRDRFLEMQACGILESGLAESSVESLLNKSLETGSGDALSHFYLAQIFEGRSEWWKAALQYLSASASSDLKMQALFRSGLCFSKAGHNAAAQSCFRRSREFEISDVQKRVLYNLARSYEDDGEYSAARDIYDVLLTWDISYRDVAYRLAQFERGATLSTRKPIGEIDYTGLTVSLLGPDAPRVNEVDATLLDVIKSRAQELHVSQQERAAYLDALRLYSNDQGHSPKQLAYDVISYLKYDHSPPEDEIKKKLELINVTALLKEFSHAPTRSLDLGAATGRYPTHLAKSGVEAFGMDLEIEAAKYASRNIPPGLVNYPKYVVGNATNIPFPDNFFDLITCMMGTFSHLPEADQQSTIAEAYRILSPGGVFLISTWDIECPHLAFLTMYTQDEKKKISTLSPTQGRARGLLTKEGFNVFGVRPFALIPDVFSYELGLQELGAKQMNVLVEIDLAIRSNFPLSHGQMFVIAGRKPQLQE